MHLFARPSLILEIYLAERYHVARPGRAAEVAPEAAVVGPMTQPGVELGFVGSIDTFTVHFQPAGLSRLFGVPMQALADEAGSVSDVLGPLGDRLVDAVRRAPTFEDRVACAETWVAGQLAQARPVHAVDHAALLLFDACGRPDVQALADLAGLSVRQFQRRFLDHVGVAPKHYARLCRIAGVVAAREAAPLRSLTELAHEFGYADQAHLTREFRALSNRTPRDFFAPADVVAHE